jgi:RHS repeat-associated protein
VAKTCFFWDELEDNIVEEFDDAGNTIADYTTEPNHFGNVISQHRSGQSGFFHYDALGSTLALTDDNQQVTDTRAYSAFGETTENSSGIVFPFQYVGRSGYYQQNAPEQYIVRRRAYNPVRAVWTSRDPLHSLLSSLYHYCGNSPQTRVDPSGYEWLEVPTGTYMALSDDETFENLIRDVVPYLSSKNKSCIRPIPSGERAIDARIRARWRIGKPARCALYDLGNLLDLWPDGGHLRAGIGSDTRRNRYIAAASAFYGADHFKRTALLVAAIEKQSSTGSHPLSALTLIGHGVSGSNRIGSLTFGVGEFFSFSDLGPDPFKWPDFDHAVAGKFPYACYFRTDASVRFVGCKTSAIASRTALSILRFGATAYGTLANTYAVSDAEMGWADKDFELDRDIGTATSPAAYHRMTKAGKPLWRGYAGRN